MSGMKLWARRATPGELALMLALRQWERQMTRESLQRWLVHGAISALAVANAVLFLGWLVPQPESELRPWAVGLAMAPLFAVIAIALWPRSHLRQAAALDLRLELGDRLSTAWAYRDADQPIIRLQREDAISRLTRKNALTSHPLRSELIAVAALAAVFVLLLLLPSPQQGVIDRQAAEQAAISAAGERMASIGAEALANPSLTVDQARQINEVLQRMQLELSKSHSQREATAVLARAQQQLAQQVGDPNADLRTQALAAMSDTLAAEPTTQALADALQSQDPRATSDAMKALEAQADSLSDVERQALSRALQRAANVGRADPRTASALRDAAQALNSRDSPDNALGAADAALQDAVQSARAEAAVNTTLQRLHELESQLATGEPLQAQTALPASEGEADNSSTGLLDGTPVALDGLAQLRDPRPSDKRGAGVTTASISTSAETSQVQPAENVFVPGRQSTGPSSQDLVDQPFTVRGQPRPFRDVLSQYAASSRDYVERPDVSPAVRDLVKQYFQSLEDGP